MRNLLENNAQNQAIVEQLSPQGPVQHPVLQEIGLQTELRDGQVNIRRPWESAGEILGEKKIPRLVSLVEFFSLPH